MKIQQSQIRLPSHLLSGDLIKILQKNSLLNVKIIKIINQRYAILDIGGKKLKAEFLQGVPDSDSIQLILQRKVNNTYFFKIINSGGQKGIEEILKFTVISDKDFEKFKLYELKSDIKNIHSIFALNNAILKFTGFTNKIDTKKIADLFNLLLSKGVKYETLMLLNQLIFSKSTAFQQLFFILSKIFPGFNKNIHDKDTKHVKKENIIKAINDFSLSVDKIITKEDTIDAIHNILNFILSDNTDEILHGDIIFFENNEFKLCKYIINENSVFLSLNLTCLDEIDIIIKNNNSYYSVAFCCRKEESIELLKSGVNELDTAIKRYYKKNVHVFFHNSSQVIEKIIEIISSMDLDYLLDVKA